MSSSEQHRGEAAPVPQSYRALQRARAIASLAAPSQAQTGPWASRNTALASAASTPYPYRPTQTEVWQPRPRKTPPHFCVRRLKVLSHVQEIEYIVLTALWIVANASFWMWWLTHHTGDPVLFGLMSVALFYTATVLPSFYTFYLGCMRRPEPVPAQRPVEEGIVTQVAMITLHVPGSESIEVVRRQLIAIAKVEYPHDSWILVDGVHSEEIKALATSLGVRYFSRHDTQTWGEDLVKRWNQPVHPFKAKTKAGNVNSWIDAYGYLYSHFTQLDIDHTPQQDYLHRVLGFFLDPKVAWVQAPSVYSNFHSWTARGSAEQEFVLQGPMQMGFFGFSRTPFIIGSHTTYSMDAIRRIGGFQPTRAEDHLDTVVLAAAGYQGVYWPEPIAWGDGPENFESYSSQQFAWAYSMIQVLLQYTPKCLRYYTRRQALQFLFVQTWYPLSSTMTFLLFALPVVALFTNTPVARVGYWQYMLHMLPVFAIATLIWWWSRAWHRPRQIRLSWRSVILQIARWPIVLSALIQVVMKVKKPYMITVKGVYVGGNRPFALKTHSYYFVLIASSLGACWFYLTTFRRGAAEGYLLFALMGAAMVLLVYLVTLFTDMRDLLVEGVASAQCLKFRAKPLLVLCVTCTVLLLTITASSAPIYEAISWGTPFAATVRPPAIGILTVEMAPALRNILHNPTEVHFTQPSIGSTSTAQTIHVVNLAPASLTLATVSTARTTRTTFGVRDGCTGAPIRPYGACTIRVTFTPRVRGTYSARLLLTDQLARSSQTTQSPGGQVR